MAYSLLASTSIASTGCSSVTTSSIDTTGCNLIILSISIGDDSIPTDSNSNIWAGLSTRFAGGGSSARVKIYYCLSPTVGSGHTFTVTSTNCPSIQVLAFSGAKSSLVFDVENGNQGTASTSVTTGSISPVEDNELIIAAVTIDGASGTVSEDSGFTEAFESLFSTSNHYGLVTAYKIQTTAGAENVTFSWSGAVHSGSVIASFKSEPPAPPPVGQPFFTSIGAKRI